MWLPVTKSYKKKHQILYASYNLSKALYICLLLVYDFHYRRIALNQPYASNSVGYSMSMINYTIGLGDLQALNG